MVRLWGRCTLEPVQVKEHRAADPHRASSPCSYCDAHLSQRVAASQVTGSRTLHKMLEVPRRHECKRIQVLCFLLEGDLTWIQEETRFHGAGRGGEDSSQARVCPALLCVFSQQAQQGSKGQGGRLCTGTGQRQLEKQDPEQRQLLETAGDTRYSQQQLSR